MIFAIREKNIRYNEKETSTIIKRRMSNMKKNEEFIEETVVDENDSTVENVDEQTETTVHHKKPWLLRHPLFAKLSTYFIVAAGGVAAGYVISKKVIDRCAVSMFENDDDEDENDAVSDDSDEDEDDD